MQNCHPQTVRTLMMAAGLVAGSSAYAAPILAQTTEPGSNDQSSVNVKQQLEQASDLIAVSKAVKAKAILSQLATAPGVTFSDTDRAQLATLLKSAEARLKLLSSTEISLQKADLALESGDLTLADQHAKAVATSSKASALDLKHADEITGAVDGKRREIAAKAPGAIRSAVNLFDSGKFLEAKAVLETISRSGVTLTPDQQQAVEDYQGRILALAQTRGELFASAGMLQPGVIKPLAPKTPDPAPATPVDPAPAPAAPAPAAPAPAQPTATPAAAPAADPVDEAKKKAAAELLTKADAAFAASKWKEAHDSYTEALRRFGPVLTPEQTNSANANVARAAIEMRKNVPAPSSVLEDENRRRTVRMQQFEAEFNNALMEADNAIKSANTPYARELVAQAALRLNENRTYMSDPAYNEHKKRVDTAEANLQAAELANRNAEAAARDKALQEAAAGAEKADKASKSQKIRESIDRVRALQAERKYREALQVVNQILFLDPLNPTGLLLRDVLTDMQVYSDYNKGEDEIARSIQQLSLDNLGSLMVPHAIVDYPKDWPSISALRTEALAYQESPENRRVLATLENTRLPKVDFPDTTVKAALEYLRTVANLNMDVDWKSLEAVGIQQDATVSLSITNPTLKTVLNRVLDKVSNALDPNSRAGWTVADGVLQVASSDQLKRNKLMIIYDVKDLLFDVNNKTNVPEFDLQQAFQGSAGGGGGGGGGQSPFQTQNNQNQDTQRPLEERINDLRKIIVEQVDRDGWSDNGGDTGTIQPFRDNLIINTTPANHREVEGLLGQLRRVRNMQINVEARFLTVSQDFYEKIGFNANVYFGAGSSQISTLRAAGNYDVLPSDFFSGGKYSPPRTLGGGTQTLHILGANGLPIPTVAEGPAFPYTVNPPVPTGFSPVGAISNTSTLVNTLLGASTSKFGTQPALGISGTYLDDVQVDFLVEATQSDKRSVSVNAPRLTFSNGQYAYVAVADQQAYVSALRPAAGQGTIGLEPQINFVNDGITLYVGGVILADRRYVQLDVKIVVSALKALISRDITAVAGGAGGGLGGGGGGTAGTVTGQIQLPEVVVQTVETTVTVPDQGTVLLGGQRLSKEVEAESGVPVLSKIPILNRFFSNRAMTREEFSLLMLIKPTVLIQDETEDVAFPGLRDALRTGGL